MANLSITKPEQLKVFVRSNTKLAFISYVEKGILKKEVSIKSWLNQNYEYVDRERIVHPNEEYTLENIPTKGFKIADLRKRSSEWFGSGRHVWRIEHPKGFIFEISSENLFSLLENSSVIDGEIMEECVIAFSGAMMSLVSTNSELYKQTFVNEQRKISKVKTSDVKVGQKIQLQNGTEGIFLGKHNVVIKKDSDSYSTDYRYNKSYVEEYSIKKAFIIDTEHGYDFCAELKVAYVFDIVEEKSSLEENFKKLKEEIEKKETRKTKYSLFYSHNKVMSLIEPGLKISDAIEYIPVESKIKYLTNNKYSTETQSVYDKFLYKDKIYSHLNNDKLGISLSYETTMELTDKDTIIFSYKSYDSSRNYISLEELKNIKIFKIK